ncbi:response regulator transcription factor [Bradyrhizobium iriomotense]|uniref:response regulator transcription factor n=1 Tax=Bradyrhizobium iriomotense TaxID=441950 RepID=UPI0024E0B888|nr:hypothetical protein [Bradyrhizobium iriomotense]
MKLFGSSDEFLVEKLADFPSCVVLDVRFPGHFPERFGSAANTADSRASGSVVFISGHSDVRISVQAMKLGADEVLPEPFREQELLDAIRLALEDDRKRRDRELVERDDTYEEGPQIQAIEYTRSALSLAQNREPSAMRKEEISRTTRTPGDSVSKARSIILCAIEREVAHKCCRGWSKNAQCDRNHRTKFTAPVGRALLAATARQAPERGNFGRLRGTCRQIRSFRTEFARRE